MTTSAPPKPSQEEIQAAAEAAQLVMDALFNDRQPNATWLATVATLPQSELAFVIKGLVTAHSEKGVSGVKDAFAALIKGRPWLSELRSKPLPKTDPGAGQEEDYTLITVSELDKLPSPKWILDRILDEIAVSFLFGPSGSAKSFIALAWSIAIALGIPWLGHTTKQGMVVYVAAEGLLGYRRRLRAWSHFNQILLNALENSLFFLPRPVPLMADSEVDKLIAAIKRTVKTGQHLAMVVLDTLSQCLAGEDENSTAVASGAIKTAIRLKRELGCQVLIVHHTGKDLSKGMRGNSAFFAGADATFKAERDAKYRDEITLTAEKQKDDEEISVLLKLQKVVYGEGDRDNSCVLLGREASTDPLQLTSIQKSMLDALTGPMAYTAWWKAVIPELSKSTFNENRDALLRMKLIEKCDLTPSKQGYQKRQLSKEAEEEATSE